MPFLGAHMSIAGGYHKAVAAAEKAGCDCVQIFTKNNNQWRAKPISDAEAERFQAAMTQSKLEYPLSHSSYLINLGTPDDELWKKSIDAFVVELRRAQQLGIPHVVLHPGAYTTSSIQLGIARVVSGLDEAFGQTSELTTKCLLETTAGQGSSLGWRFEELGEMMSRSRHPNRLAICVDTCHVFAAGYPLTSPADYKATMNELDSIVGISAIAAIHLNDSKRELGSRVDRHEHIGEGCIGRDGFRNILGDDRLANIPMYLETPKGTDDRGRDYDELNLKLLRRLAK